MSGAATGRDVEALRRVIARGSVDRTIAGAVLSSDWYAARIAEAQRRGADDVTARIRTLAGEWTCDCDPGPEGQHREWCRSYFGQRLRAALRGQPHPSTDPDG